MGELLPDRYPNRDFFIVDVSDTGPKDDLASMEHPVFSLATKPDKRELSYRTSTGKRLTVGPSSKGLATIFDKDILLYCISKLVHLKNEYERTGSGKEITPIVEFSAHECMVACNWRTNDAGYRRFRDALYRLRGTTLVTDIETGGKKASKVFGLIDEGEIVSMKDGEQTPFEDEGRMSRVRIKLSEWIFRSVQSDEVLSIDRKYFRIRRPLERRLYELARKHVGNKTEPWKIGIEKLQTKVGTCAPLKKFRFNLKEIIRDGNIPEYGFQLDGDMVVMQRIDTVPPLDMVDLIPLRADTLDKGQKIAAQLRVSVFDLHREWSEWSRSKDEAPDNADAAFIAFCKQKIGSAHAQRVVTARQEAEEAEQLGFVLPDIK